MKFDKGQKVKVKSKEQLLKWFGNNDFTAKEDGSFRHRNSMTFTREMFAWCDCVLTINRNYIGKQWYIHEVKESSWCFLSDWLLPVMSTFIEVDDEF